jgi:squalene monooxygenase
MPPNGDFDVIIAGGGVAGVATAAALAEFAWSVLIVEPGQRTERRLAGEVIHPPGVAGLIELGLYDRAGLADAVSLEGFHVFQHDAAEGDGILLPYEGDGVTRTALGLEHGAIRTSLLTSAARLGHVTIWHGARVVGLDLTQRGLSRVSIAHRGKIETLGFRMMVGADGATSRVRALTGVVHSRQRLSNITGYLIDAEALPTPGFGHVFMGTTAPVLAYPIGAGRARVLIDQPIQSLESPADHRARAMATLPPRLRAAIDAAIATQRGLGFVSADVLVAAAGRGPVVLVGDAGGSCHPLTATGMTVGIGDALRLRQALRDRDGDIVRGIALYARRRRAPQRARRLLTSALHETCSRQDAGACLIRDTLLGYWRRDARGRAASMALLAMTDTRIGSILGEMLQVLRHGMSCGVRRERAGILAAGRLTMAIAALLARQVPMVMKGR